MTARLVVLSGGQDSTTCLFWAVAKAEGPVEAVTFDYGQRHGREIDAARTVAGMAGVSLRLVQIGPILEGRSPLTNEAEELEQYSDFSIMDQIIGDRVELTFVPMRNALFLTLAANMAAARNISRIVTGVCQADNANYPDCRRSFIDSMETMAAEALGEPLLKIETPLMDLPKADTVRLAMSLPGCYRALAYSHTAYDGRYPPTGADHATVLRAHGFEQAGVPDPLLARAVFENLIPVPPTPNYDILRAPDGPRDLDALGAAIGAAPPPPPPLRHAA
jgi:7-cyano-7-deazaguanine synthase